MDNLEKLASQGTQDEQKHNTICVEYHYTQTNTNNKTKKDMSPPTNNWREPLFITTDITTRNSECKDK